MNVVFDYNSTKNWGTLILGNPIKSFSNKGCANYTGTGDDTRYGSRLATLSANNVNPIYSDDCDTVQPPAVVLLPCIKY